ncbi:MAG: hypothetical protein HBSAPP03_20620 [Phycisphaerae bacterium]|nr:MAG: hypothetical protein HBSAPP03_20620 [Phycisphaerae bacterium]
MTRRDSMMLLVVLLYTLALGVSVVMVVQGRVELGIGGVLLTLTLMPVVMVMLRAGAARERALLDRLDEIARTVRTMADQSSLSDEARRILNRESDREMLRLAIEEDLAAQHWDAALVLIRELADRFGYRADAEEYRKRIDQMRERTTEQQVTDAIGLLDGLILQRRWDDAALEAAKIQRLFPYSPRVEPLQGRVEQARASYKTDLERRFLLAAQADKVDEALTLLKELDFYLTPTEAEPLREVTRGLIGKARQNLGAQFKLALQDRRWGEAARIGEAILHEFPNTRMAAEVRELLDGIRAKANAVDAPSGA